jgi:hypothetical protein
MASRRGILAVKSRWAGWRVVVFVLAGSLGAGGEEKGSSSPPGRDGTRGSTEESQALGMSPAVACASIDGFGNFEPLPGAMLTSDEKLQVYYQPVGYRVERMGPYYLIHLIQDGQIRRRGEKTVLQRKAKLVDYEFKSKVAPTPVYMRNTISMKGLTPGDYDLEIILHDDLAEGPPATQTLPFRIVAPAQRKAEGEEGRSRDRPAPP